MRAAVACRQETAWLLSACGDNGNAYGKGVLQLAAISSALHEVEIYVVITELAVGF